MTIANSSVQTTASKSLGGPLTPKSHESQSNIARPTALRSRFFHAEDTVRPHQTSFKPWFEDDKENFTLYSDKEKDTRSFGKMFGLGEKVPSNPFQSEKRCLQCFDKAAFVLEPCSHTYSLLYDYIDDRLCAKCTTKCINPVGSCTCVHCGLVFRLSFILI
jgi:hypothetical protein